jgi:hypothetical protein
MSTKLSDAERLRRNRHGATIASAAKLLVAELDRRDVPTHEASARNVAARLPSLVLSRATRVRAEADDVATDERMRCFLIDRARCLESFAAECGSTEFQLRVLDYVRAREAHEA